MSQQKSNLPMIITAFIFLALAGYFGINLIQKSSPEISAQNQNNTLERAQQSTQEAVENAQEAANEAAQDASQMIEQVADDAKENVDKADQGAEQNVNILTPSQQGNLAPASGTPTEPVKQ